MNRLTSLAIILMACCALSTRAAAQNAYRCGNSYSQTPCPGGVPVDADDSRSKAQKAQSESVVKRDLRTADSMEKNRLQQEEALKRATRKPTNKLPDEPTATEPTPGKKTHSTKKNSKNPEYFTARTSGDKKKKKGNAAAPAATTTGNTDAAK